MLRVSIMKINLRRHWWVKLSSWRQRTFKRCPQGALQIQLRHTGEPERLQQILSQLSKNHTLAYMCLAICLENPIGVLGFWIATPIVHVYSWCKVIDVASRTWRCSKVWRRVKEIISLLFAYDVLLAPSRGDLQHALGSSLDDNQDHRVKRIRSLLDKSEMLPYPLPCQAG